MVKSKYGSSVAEGRPDLIAQWSDKNEMSPHEARPGSTKKVWWIGPCGHEWEAAIDNRVYGNTGCPHCSLGGWKKLLPGVNDLETRFPEIAAQWHPTLNGDLKPSEVLPGTNLVKPWWLCETCGREWQSAVKMRTSKGAGCPSCRGRLRGLANSPESHTPLVFAQWSDRNLHPATHYSPKSGYRAWWRCDSGHEWQSAIFDRNVKQTECKICVFSGTSAGEVEVSDFVSSLGVAVRNHHRQIDPQFEYDITVPDKMIAIEYNGLYWHSEARKPGRYYHFQKATAAHRAGWALLNIWEDDWIQSRPIIERMIARRLGVSTERRLSARDMEFLELDSRQARSFLTANHIQGFSSGSLYLGLADGEGVRALMVMKSARDGVFRLERFATDAIVRGGFSRLLKEAIKRTGANRVITFSDNAISTGSLYEKHGFVSDGKIPPDYMYVIKNRRIHKFNYRKKRFRDDPRLKYEEGMTESQLAALNGIYKIFDAGKIRWVLEV